MQTLGSFKASNRKTVWQTLAVMLAALFVVAAAFVLEREKPIEIKLGQQLDVGRKELLFGSIVSICEDDKANFYVLDQREQKVFKFSADGRLITRFGQKGQGPGDFQSPGQIVLAAQGEMAILEDLYYVSFHKTDGTFIRRLDLNGRLGLGYIGPGRFYAWDWRPEGRQQVMVDAKNNIIRTFHTQARERFSVSLPDETGRALGFIYSDDNYVPQLLFARGGPLSAVGITDRYEISLLDEKGQSAGTISRDLKPRKFTAKEKDYLERELQEFAKSKGWPGRVARELGKKIPPHKNMVKAVRVSPENVFVFRFPQDITAVESHLPVDIFTLRGEFLGTAELPEVPLLVSAGAMYFVKSDEADNIYLTKTRFSLEF